MSRITKFLETNCEKVEKEDSKSFYYLVGDHKIRISDHLALMNVNSIQVLIPKNSQKQYVVSLPSGLYVFNSFTEIKSFLQHFIMFYGIPGGKKIKENKAAKQLRDELCNAKEQITKLKSESITLKRFTSGQVKQIKAWQKQNNI